jgi:glycerol kinase
MSPFGNGLLQSLRTAARDVVESPLATGRPIVAAGLATQRSTICCWDRNDGTPLSPALSWQDRRNAVLLERMRHLAGRVREITGLPLSPHYGASKLRWALDHVAEVGQARDAATLRHQVRVTVLHELGHHVLQHHTGKRRVCIARRADHEAHACLLATRWLTMLGSFA